MPNDITLHTGWHNGQGREPDNHAAVVDRGGDTWVRVDEGHAHRCSGYCAHSYGFGGPWWPLTDGPGWDVAARDGLGTPRDWDDMAEHGPFTVADPARAAAAVARVLREVQ